MDLRGSRVLGFTGLGFYVLVSRVFLLSLAKLPPGEAVRRTLRRVCRCAHELQKIYWANICATSYQSYLRHSSTGAAKLGPLGKRSAKRPGLCCKTSGRRQGVVESV